MLWLCHIPSIHNNLAWFACIQTQLVTLHKSIYLRIELRRRQCLNIITNINFGLYLSYTQQLINHSLKL